MTEKECESFPGHAERPVDELFLDSCSSFPASKLTSKIVVLVHLENITSDFK